MSEEQKVQRRPWWLLAAGLGSSIAMTLIYASLVVSMLGRFSQSTFVWDAIIASIFALLVVFGIISIVYYSRRRIT